MQNKGIPKIGTPQGGVLSPLLSNIVLNELDWWIDSQWHSMKTNYPYKYSADKYSALRTTKLKEMYVVRYADDFKIFCKSHSNAVKIFNAVEMWLKDRLGLEINPEKSKITNLRRGYTEFLGIKIKAVPKRKKYVIHSEMTKKSKKKCIEKLKTAIKRIDENTTVQSISNYNSTVLGVHNYYRVASMVSKDFNQIALVVRRCLYNKLKCRIKLRGERNKTFQKFYGGYVGNLQSIKGITLYPVAHIKTKPPYNFKNEICDYTVVGRALIHERLKRANMAIVRYLMQNPIRSETVEYNDNRISLYIAQNGRCRITKAVLQIGEMDAHHILPRKLNGTDKYSNLIFVTKPVHKLIHATETETIVKYLDIVKPNIGELKSINNYREKAGNHII